MIPREFVLHFLLLSVMLSGVILKSLQIKYWKKDINTVHNLLRTTTKINFPGQVHLFYL